MESPIYLTFFTMTDGMEVRAKELENVLFQGITKSSEIPGEGCATII